MGQLLGMSKLNATACALTPPLLWAGKKAQQEEAWADSSKVSFSSALKPLRPSQPGWKASPHHQAICGLTKPLSACTWAGEKSVGTLFLLLLADKGEMLFQRGGFPWLSF